MKVKGCNKILFESKLRKTSLSLFIFNFAIFAFLLLISANTFSQCNPDYPAAPTFRLPIEGNWPPTFDLCGYNPDWGYHTDEDIAYDWEDGGCKDEYGNIYVCDGPWEPHLHFGIKKGKYDGTYKGYECDCQTVKNNFYNPTTDPTNGICFTETHDRCTDCDGFTIYSPKFQDCGNPCEEHRVEIGEFDGIIAYYNYRGYDCTSYQCTEYVKRFYHKKYGFPTCSWLGHASVYFDCAHDRGLESYPNNGLRPPSCGDILCYDDGNRGHVAIVVNVNGKHMNEYNVRIIEQNGWPRTNWKNGKGFQNFIMSRDASTGRFYIPNRGSYKVEGWVRPPCTEHNADPSVKWHPNGTLIRGKDDPKGKVYLLQGGFKRWVPNPDIFNAYCFDWCKVINVDQEELDCFNTGSNVGYPNFRLVKKKSGAEAYKVYLVTENRYKRWISSLEVFEALGYNWDDIESISEDELNSYEELAPIVSIYPEGTLIKKKGENKVYVITNGHKRLIESTAFTNLGYNDNDVIEISQEDFDSIPENPKPIDSDVISQCTNEPAHLISVLGKPNGGENLASGSTFNIEGLIRGAGEYIKILFSGDRWKSFKELFSGSISSSSGLIIKKANSFTKSELQSKFRLTESQLKELREPSEAYVISYPWTVPDIDSDENSVQIVAYDASGNSVAYDISDGLFTITSHCPTPPSPTLYDPSISGNNYTISWSKVAEAGSYILQEDTDPNFSSPNEHNLIQTSKYFADRSEGTYYYRVCGVNSCGRGPWSNTKAVTISGRQWPGEITNRSPPDGATNQPLNVTLSWNCSHPAGENMVYDVWFSVSDRDYFYPSELVSAGQTGTTYTVTNLPYNTTCSWKIVVRDETGDMRTSEVYHFTTIADSNPPTGSVSINDGAATTDTLSVTLFLSATDTESGVAYMRASNDGSNWSCWRAYTSKWPAWNLADPRYGGTYAPQGTYTVYVQFKDYEGNISSIYSDSIEKVSGTPGDIILNGESYPTIQDAINAAEYGDTVYLTEGTYTYRGSEKPPRYPDTSVGIVMKVGVNLIGAGAEKTKLICEGTCLDALIDADDSLIQGLTIINADNAPAERHSVLMESSNSQICNCKITTSGPANYGIYVYEGNNNEVSNNLIINNSEGIRAQSGNGLKIYNNTIVDNAERGIKNYISDATIKNNIVTGSKYGVSVNEAIFTNNDVWGNTILNYSGDDLTGINGNISADPLFVDLGSGDYSLSSDSACIDAGTDVGIPYKGGAPDMGAFEYGGTGTVEVITNREDAAFEIIGPAGTYQGSGTYWSMSDLPIGVYSITFTPIENLYLPPYDTKILKSNQTITFNGTYSEDTIPPQGKDDFWGPVSINYGEYATADNLVDIALSFGDEVAGLGSGAQMMFSNDGVNWSPPEPYSTLKKDWDLTQFGGNANLGMKTVYVKVSDVFGNWTAPFTDTILYVPDQQILEVPEEYSTIQEALGVAKPGDIVHVLPGSYRLGEITIPQGICLQGSGPALTTIRTSRLWMSSNSKIDGFTIKGTVRCDNHITGVVISNNVFSMYSRAIEILFGSKAMVRNNIINSVDLGILLSDPGTSALIENNTIVNVTQYEAINLQYLTTEGCVKIRNNIIANNRIGIYDNIVDREHLHQIVSFEFNNYWNNTEGNVGGNSSGNELFGPGDFDADPMFIDPDNGVYTLQAGSPSINSGYPEDRYNDHDGTRNDRGAYGGSCLNTPPQADFVIDPTLVGINTPFSLDASISFDKETETKGLLIRWDFDGDGIYDTNFTTNKTETHQYNALGTHTIGLQVKDRGGFVASTTNQITVSNSPPNVPSNPTPPDGSIDQGVEINLSWQGGDPDSGDTVSYDVYFGRSSNPPLVSSGQTETTYVPGTLNYNTFYYWKIVATDNHGTSSIGPVWSFITEVEPISQAPTDLSANAVSSSQIDLSWTDNSHNEIGFKIERKTGKDGIWSQIYVVGANTTSYSDTGLSPDTSYYYRVRSYNTSGNSAYSNEANATTLTPPCPTPATPANPNPPDGATGVSINTDLDWSDCANTDSYDVYFGTSSSNLTKYGTTTSSSYNLPTLSHSTHYYWKIVAKNNCGNSTSGPVWDFITAGTCTYSISPTSKHFGPSGGTGTINVTTQAGCSWTAVSNADWITITGGSPGTGSGTVYYSVSENSSKSSRTGTITIADKTFTVTQSGVSTRKSMPWLHLLLGE